MQYRSMAAAAQADGISLTLVAGYQDADTRQAAYEARVQTYRDKRKSGRRSRPSGGFHPARRQRQRAWHRLRGRYPQRGRPTAGYQLCRDPHLRVAYGLRRGIRLYPALPAGQAGRHRHRVRAVALALCGGRKRPCHPRQRPEPGRVHRPAKGRRIKCSVLRHREKGTIIGTYSHCTGRASFLRPGF